MRKFLLLGLLVCSASAIAFGQEPQLSGESRISRDNLTLRPNSRDYNIVQRGNNHQRVIQMRTQAMVRHKQAMLNRKMAMEKRRVFLRQKMMKQQQIRQRMIRQRGMHR